MKDKEKLLKAQVKMHFWYLSALERDKAYLLLSSGGIGLLLTILSFSTNLNIESKNELFFPFLLSLFSFILCACISIIILELNSKYIHKPETYSTLLKILDVTASIALALGIIFSAYIGLLLTIDMLYTNCGKT